jgi:hypothetical protein
VPLHCGVHVSHDHCDLHRRAFLKRPHRLPPSLLECAAVACQA